MSRFSELIKKFENKKESLVFSHPTAIDNPLRFVAVDCETTGLYPWRGDRIIELAAIKVHGGKLRVKFEHLIDCGRSVPKEVQKLNGITDEMLAGQPKPERAFRDFLNFIGEEKLIAHNASFDRSFLQSELERLGLSLANPMECSLHLSRQKLPDLPNHRLVTVFRHLFPEEIRWVKAHRALVDAWMVAMIWIAMQNGN